MLLRNREARRALIACIVLTIAGSAVASVRSIVQTLREDAI